MSIFEILNSHFGEITKNICNFFVIFNQDNVLFILIEFEDNRISPRESHIRFLRLKLPQEKNFMLFQWFWNFCFLTTRKCQRVRKKKTVFECELRWDVCFWEQKLFFSLIFSFLVSFSQNLAQFFYSFLRLFNSAWSKTY